MDIAKSLRVSMAVEGISGGELSEATGISERSISFIKNGRSTNIGTEVLRKLADHFNMKVSEFIGLGE